MPIYEFRCAPEGHVFEIFVMSGEEQCACPKCGSQQLERMMSTFASNGKGNAVVASAPSPGPTQRGCGGGCACH